MRNKRFDGSDSRRVLVGMVLDRMVCSRISSQWTSEGLFNTRWANLVGGWCVNHFKKYGSAPNGQLVGIFENWADRTTSDEKTVDAVEKFLHCLSDESNGQPIVSDYILDIAGKHFNKVRMEKELEATRVELDRGEVDDAQNRLAKLQKVNLGKGSFVEPDSDSELWIQAFSRERRKPLITYPGDLGKFIGDSFARGTLYSFMGPDKVGKTTWLFDLAYRALRKRNKVVIFDVGDGDEEEAMIRLACRTSHLPEYGGDFRIPVEWNGEGPIFRTDKLKSVDPINSYRAFKKEVSRSKGSLRISCHPNSSVTVEDIDGILTDWDRDGYRPDVVIIDYVDILAPPQGLKDRLDQIDETWKQLRKISQQRHCLVLTATQSSALAYGKEDGLLSKRHFSGRKTKLATVNGMLGINVSPEEKEKGLGRINWIVRRKGKYNEKQYVRIAGCMAIGNPAIQSKR